MLTRGEEVPMDITEIEDVELIVLDEERTAEGGGSDRQRQGNDSQR
jgi:hypothetical protein